MDVVSLFEVFGAGEDGCEFCVCSGDVEVHSVEIGADGVVAGGATWMRALKLHTVIFAAEDALFMLDLALHNFLKDDLSGDTFFEGNLIVFELD